MEEQYRETGCDMKEVREKNRKESKRDRGSTAPQRGSASATDKVEEGSRDQLDPGCNAMSGFRIQTSNDGVNDYRAGQQDSTTAEKYLHNFLNFFRRTASTRPPCSNLAAMSLTTDDLSSACRVVYITWDDSSFHSEPSLTGAEVAERRQRYLQSMTVNSHSHVKRARNEGTDVNGHRTRCRATVLEALG